MMTRTWTSGELFPEPLHGFGYDLFQDSSALTTEALRLFVLDSVTVEGFHHAEKPLGIFFYV